MTTNRKARRAAKNGSGIVPPSDALRVQLAEALAALERGDAVGAATVARAAVAAFPRSADAFYLLGNALLFQSRHSDAAASYQRAIRLAPRLPEAHNNLGIALERQGKAGDAISCYRAAIACRDDYAEARNNLGNVLLASGQPEAAVESLRTAVTARNAYPEAHCNLANALARLGRGGEAVAAYRQALVQRPSFPEALNNLSALLLELGRAAEAVEAGRQAVAVAPQMPESHYTLGNALRDNGQPDDAVAAYRRTLALRPADADAHIALGNLLQSRNQIDEAQGLFRRAHQLRPLDRRPGIRPVPDFSALLLTAPGSANTPSDYLIGRAGYDTYSVALLSGVDYDIDRLRRHADVVINLISDVDWAGAILPQVVELVDRIGRPTINHPRRILDTGRERIAARLADIPGCRVPRTIRRAGRTLLESGALTGFSFPVLVRVTGAHGGDRFEKLDDADAVSAFIARQPNADYYATEYVPYESPDGFFRKYRLIFIDGRIFPYHLAIADHWKAHHFTTRMAENEWMRREEEAFVKEPAHVFGAIHWRALREIQSRIGLDYCGIDCALDPSGALVVFEVNATMLVHGETGIFAYKTPYVAKIKEAFDAMLGKAARSTPR